MKTTPPYIFLKCPLIKYYHPPVPSCKLVRILSSLNVYCIPLLEAFVCPAQVHFQDVHWWGHKFQDWHYFFFFWLVPDMNNMMQSARDALQQVHENAWLYIMFSGLATLTQIEIWVCESADGQLAESILMCVFSEMRMRVFTIKKGYGGRQASTISPETWGQPIRPLFCSFSSDASPLSLSSHICSQSPLMCLSEQESHGKLAQCALSSFQCALLCSQLPSEESLQQRQIWAGPLLWWRALWLLPGDFSQPGMSLTAWSQKAE